MIYDSLISLPHKIIGIMVSKTEIMYAGVGRVLVRMMLLLFLISSFGSCNDNLCEFHKGAP